MSGNKFILQPNLPENKVHHVVMSAQYEKYCDSLRNLDIEPILIDSCNSVLPPVSQHTDMLFLYLGNGEYIVEKNQIKLKQQLDYLGFDCLAKVNLMSEYPDDILLNSCIVGDKIICYEKFTVETALDKFNVINVKQGYAKCSCVVVDENSIITDDESIALCLNSVNIDVLLVHKGSVILEGFDYGFIGGCCGKIAKDILAFCGDIRTHSDFKQIDAFLRERKVYPLSLTSGNLFDIGSIIPVTEIL